MDAATPAVREATAMDPSSVATETNSSAGNGEFCNEAMPPLSQSNNVLSTSDSKKDTGSEKQTPVDRLQRR